MAGENESKVNIAIKTAADLTAVDATANKLSTMADKVSVSQWGFYDLGTEIKKTTDRTEGLVTGMRGVERPVRNNSLAILELSRGLEDAQYGIRGVLNNIPSLVLSLGGSAGLAGAISIAAVGLSQLEPLFTQTGESAEDAAEKVKELTDRMAEAEGRRFDQVADSLEAAGQRIKAQRQNWDDTAAAERSYSAAALTNAEALAKAQQEINDALGIQKDRLKELAAAAELEAQKRADAAQSAIALERKKQNDATIAVQNAARDLEVQKARADQEKQNLAALRERLAALEEEKFKLQQIASADAARSAQTQGPFSAPGAYQTNQAAADARANLQSPQFTAAIDGLKARIANLEENLLSLTKDGGVVNKAETALIAAQTKLVDVNKAVEIKSAEIVQNFETADITGKVSAIGDRTKAIVSGIEENFTNIQTTNQQGREAVERIKTAISDGRIAADEQAQLSRDLITLIGLLQTGQASSRQSVQSMINVQTTTNAEINRINAELDRLNGKVGSLLEKY